MAVRNVVVRSVNLEGDTRCVDVFRRPDGTYGFGEYRREPEDLRGWFEIGLHSAQVYSSSEQAISAAQLHVHWLTAAVRKD